MKLEGFIGPAYQLDSSNVDAQRCVNLYAEAIESGRGKEGQVAYLRGTPGLEKVLEVGNGPIRCVHTDSIGRIFVASGNKFYHINRATNFKNDFKPISYSNKDFTQFEVDHTTDTIEVTAHGYYTGLKVQITDGSGTANLNGVTFDQDYWVIVESADLIKLASSLANAVAGTAVDITSGSAGNDFSVEPQIPASILGKPRSVFDADNDQINIESHGFYEGLRVRLFTTGGKPSELLGNIDHYVIAVDSDNFQLANSIANASAGTEVAFTAQTGDWEAIELKSSGMNGGDPITMATSTGEVKAASMSFLGDGSDSSTVFVDGDANYLFKEEADQTTFQYLGSIDVVEADFTFTSGVDFSIYTNQVDQYEGESVSLVMAVGATAGEVDVEFTLIGSVFRVNVTASSDTTLTSRELVEILNNGSLENSSKTVNITDTLNLLSVFEGSGGDNSNLIDPGFSGSDTQASTLTAATIDGAGLGEVQTATHIVWSDGYFIVNQAGTNKFFTSGLQDFVINALDFASSEGSPDIVVALEIARRDLYVFNELTTEVYVNTGNADFPYERVQGGFIEVGCAAGNSVARLDTEICWLGKSKDGQGIVYLMQGLQYKRISTHAIEQAIAGYADISNASAFTYQMNGHGFYVLNFDEATWVYDFATGMWHERAYLNNGNLERHRAGFHTFSTITQDHIVGDYANNKIYLLKDDYYFDDTDAIKRLRTSPHISATYDRIFFHRFQLDMEVGIGLDGGVQGSDPTVSLDWSDDGGKTWSSEQFALADAGGGEIGEYLTRVIWRRLGKSRDRIFRVQISDPVKVRLINADIDFSKGAT